MTWTTGTPPSASPCTTSGPSTYVVTRGELDLFSAPRLRDVLSDAGPCAARHLALDLSALRSLDSVGIDTIIEGRQLCAARGGRVVVVALTGTAVHKILHILGLQHVLEIAESREIAMESLEVDPTWRGHEQEELSGHTAGRGRATS